MAASTLDLDRRKQQAAVLKESRGFEHRQFAASEMSLRAQGDDVLQLHGYASVVNTPYDMGFYEEVIKGGSFRRTLSEDPDVQLLINHSGLPLARSKSGTMSLTEDVRGLRVEASLNAGDPDVLALAPKLERRDVDAMSFAFVVREDSWSEDYTRREISDLSLHRGDVSIVSQPANPATSATLREREPAIPGDRIASALREWRAATLLPVERRSLSHDAQHVLGSLLGGRSALAELLRLPAPTPPSTRPKRAYSPAARARIDHLLTTRRA